MTRNEAIKKYTKKFGGFPYFLCMGMDPKDLVRLVEKSLKTGKEIKPSQGRIY